VGFLFVATGIKELLLSSATAKAFCNAIAILAALALAALYVVGMFGPLVTLIDSLST